MTEKIKTHEISVRRLAEMLFQSGDLSSVTYSSVSGLEGTRLHQKVFSDLKRKYTDLLIETEYPLNKDFISDQFLLKVKGRADCIVKSFQERSEDYTDTIIEVKSHNQQDAEYDQLFRAVHRAQLMMYAHMYLNAFPQKKEVNISIRYVSVQTLHYSERIEIVTRDAAESFFNDLCLKYLAVAKILENYRNRRNESIYRLPFPYDNLREGQKELMERVVSSIRSKQILFAEAPTGIGKTIGVLFPALKCLAREQGDKVFYLTAKTSTRDIARKALSDMRSVGLYLRSILLSAKETLCPCREIYCEPKICKYAIGYYDRLKTATEDLFGIEDITPEVIMDCALRNSICPHELSLDISLFCDVIIGDYNHAFHPRVKLERFFAEPDKPHIILADESHNLVDRSRDMFSSQLNYGKFKEFKSSVRGMNRIVDGHAEDIENYFTILYNSIKSEATGIDSVESSINSSDVMKAENYRAARTAPKTLYGMLWRLCFHLSDMLDSIPVGPIRKSILDFFFDARFFLTVLEQFFDNTYVFACRIPDHSPESASDNMNLILFLSCLDASGKIHDQIADKHSCIFFSATLSPIEYYRAMLLGEDWSLSETLHIDSPFAPENLKVVISSQIRTVFRERSLTASEISNIVISTIISKKGNYIAYFPSFKYMNMISKIIIGELGENRNIRIIIQSNDMTLAEKAEYLNHFESYGEKTLLAFAVLGGHFGEGIDLVGEKLNGVFIVGVGIPQISPEREILRQYYQEKFGDGYAYAYRFPGWEKVFQASGRVIRDENDKGFVVLLDHRYALAEYKVLFPDHWTAKYADNTANIPSMITD